MSSTNISTKINILIVLLFICLVFAQAGKKFVLDEIDFPIAANATSENWLTLHYRGEAEKSSLGLWHPPLYMYTLAAFIKAFGFNENSIRAFGLICTLISAQLCLKIFNLLARDAAVTKLFSSVFLSLFLLHPYTIANTTVPDIDTTVLPITILLLIYNLIKLFSGPTFKTGSVESYADLSKRCLVTAVFVSLTLWAKLTTPLAALPAMFFLLLAMGRPLLFSFCFIAASSFIGAFFFLATYFAYCKITGLPFDFTFNFLLYSFGKNTAESPSLAVKIQNYISHLSYGKQFVNWLSLPLLATVVASAFYIGLQKGKSTLDKALLVFLGLGAFVTIFYLTLTGPFGGFFKYPYATFPLLMISTSYFISNTLTFPSINGKSATASYKDLLGRLKTQIPFILAISILTIAIIQTYLYGDKAIRNDIPVSGFTLVIVTLLGAVGGAIFATVKYRQFLSASMAAFFAILLGSQIGISRSQAVAPYPTKYHYGLTGFEQTISYLKENLALDEPIWAMKDIGQYVGHRFYQNYMDIFKPKEQLIPTLNELIDSKGVRFFIVTQGIGEDRVDAYRDLKESLEACCKVEKSFGNFVIYRAHSNE